MIEALAALVGAAFSTADVEIGKDYARLPRYVRALSPCLPERTVSVPGLRSG